MMRKLLWIGVFYAMTMGIFWVCEDPEKCVDLILRLVKMESCPYTGVYGLPPGQ